MKEKLLLGGLMLLSFFANAVSLTFGSISTTQGSVPNGDPIVVPYGSGTYVTTTINVTKEYEHVLEGNIEIYKVENGNETIIHTSTYINSWNSGTNTSVYMTFWVSGFAGEIKAVFYSSTNVRYYGNTYPVIQTIYNNSISASETLPSGTSTTTISGSSAQGGDGTVTYQWQSSPNGSSWSNIGGATGRDYAPGVIGSTTYYQRICSSGAAPATTSNIVTKTIVQINNTIPSTVNFTSGQNPVAINGNAATSGAGAFSYQWQVKGGPAPTWTNISSPQGTSEDISATLISDGWEYRRLVISGGVTHISNTCTLVMIPIGGNSIPSSVSYSSGQTPVLINAAPATSPYGTITYQWQSKGGPSPSWSNIASPQGTSEDLSATLIFNGVQYRRIAKVGTTYSHTSNTCILSLSARIGDTDTELVEETVFFNVYPNPSSLNEVVVLKTDQTNASLAKVYDVNGNEVYRTAIAGSQTELTFAPTTGIYLIVIETQNGEILSKQKHVVR